MHAFTGPAWEQEDDITLVTLSRSSGRGETEHVLLEFDEPSAPGNERRIMDRVASSVRELSDRARNGQLKPDDMAGGTITITNLGAYGVDGFTPIINPPQAAILGIGRIVARPVSISCLGLR